MTITKCDRCGKNLDLFPFTIGKPQFFHLKFSNFPLVESEELDLCEACQQDLLNWLNIKREDAQLPLLSFEKMGLEAKP